MITGIVTWLSNVGLSAFVNSLEVPDATSGKFYRFMFRFSHYVISGNYSRSGVEKPVDPNAPKP
jgi:hypothetical protein